MTTTVVYGNAIRSLDLGNSANTITAGTSTGTQLIGNLSTYLGGVTRVQQVNNSASTTNPTATFTTTPVSGNAMIAIVIRGADNQASTNSSWTLLTSAGSAGSRRLEIWWRRAGASEPTTHTWTNGTAALWEVTLLECGGWAAITNPRTITAAANNAANTQWTAGNGGPFAVGAVVTAAGGAGTMNVTNALGFLESFGALPITTTTRFCPFYGDTWVNYPDDVSGLGETRPTVTWTTSRAFTAGYVGWPEGSTKGPSNGFASVGQAVFSNTGPYGQAKLTFDTSAIPSSNTVTSATLSLKSSTQSGWPADASVDAYKITSGASFTTSNSPAWWQTATDIASLTRVASRAAGSAWATSTVYDWTSDSTFPAQITKAGSTSLLLVTGDQAAGSGSSRTSANYCYPSGTASDHYLTIVHNLQLSRTVAASSSLTPAITQIVSTVRSVASTVGVISTSTRLASYARTIAATVTTTASIVATLVPIVIGIPHKISLRVRSTVTLPGLERIRLTVRSRLRLPE